MSRRRYGTFCAFIGLLSLALAADRIDAATTTPTTTRPSAGRADPYAGPLPRTLPTYPSVCSEAKTVANSAGQTLRVSSCAVVGTVTQDPNVNNNPEPYVPAVDPNQTFAALTAEEEKFIEEFVVKNGRLPTIEEIGITKEQVAARSKPMSGLSLTSGKNSSPTTVAQPALKAKRKRHSTAQMHRHTR